MPWAYLTALALTFIFSFTLGIFTIIINPKSRVHQLWFLTTMGVCIWSGVWFFVHILKLNNDLGLLLSRVLHIGANFLIIFFFHFILKYLQKENNYKVILIIGYTISILFLIVIFIPHWFIEGMSPKAGFDIWFEAGILYPLFVIYFLIYTVLSIRLLYKEYKRSDGLKRKQIYFILLAAIIGIGGGITNFLPQLFNIYPFGTFVIFLYPLIITYGIFLQEVKVKF